MYSINNDVIIDIISISEWNNISLSFICSMYDVIYDNIKFTGKGH